MIFPENWTFPNIPPHISMPKERMTALFFAMEWWAIEQNLGMAGASASGRVFMYIYGRQNWRIAALLLPHSFVEFDGKMPRSRGTWFSPPRAGNCSEVKVELRQK